MSGTKKSDKIATKPKYQAPEVVTLDDDGIRTGVPVFTQEVTVYYTPPS